MFYRVRHDKSGWEPRRLFNIVEFMMHDKVRRAREGQEGCWGTGVSWCHAHRLVTRAYRHATLPPPSPTIIHYIVRQDCSGTIDIDECMEILFRRFGKDMLESKVR